MVLRLNKTWRMWHPTTRGYSSYNTICGSLQLSLSTYFNVNNNFLSCSHKSSFHCFSSNLASSPYWCMQKPRIEVAIGNVITYNHLSVYSFMNVVWRFYSSLTCIVKCWGALESSCFNNGRVCRHVASQNYDYNSHCSLVKSTFTWIFLYEDISFSSIIQRALPLIRIWWEPH